MPSMSILMENDHSGIGATIQKGNVLNAQLFYPVEYGINLSACAVKRVWKQKKIYLML